MKKLVFISIPILIFTLVLGAWEDEELFFTQIKPNIMILFDSSISMNTIIFHPDYVPNGGTGNFDRADTSRTSTMWMARWYYNGNSYLTRPENDGNNSTHINESDGTTKFRVGNNGWSYFNVGETILAVSYNMNRSEAICTIKNKWQDTNGNPWFEVENIIGGPITTSSDWDNIAFQRADSSSWEPRIVNIYGGYDNGRNILYIEDYLQWMFNNASDQQRAEITHFAEYGTFDTSDTTYHTDTRVRIRVARKSITGIIEGFWDKVKMGLFNFNYDDGGRLQRDIYELSVGTYKQDLLDVVNSQAGTSYTPLAETLAEIWRYFRGTRSFYPNNPATYTHPCDLWCRKNFVIIMTDGDPTQDTMYYNSVDPMRGDWDGDGDDPGSYATSGTDYLDDVAYYMFNNDAQPSLQETQNVYTYTIGFTTAGQANTLLQATADNGQGASPGTGKFYQAQNYQQLLNAFGDILGEIMEKTMAFAAFAAPKYSSFGRRGYVATFIPKRIKALWEGHLKGYNLNDDGDFETDSNGALINELWDAGDLLRIRTDTGTQGTTTGSGSRAIYTFLSGSLQDFVKSNTILTNALFGVTTDTERDNIIDVIRGTTDPHGYGYKLGDLFHFTPVSVGAPLSWKGQFDASYQSFYDEHQSREEVIYVGANDGMLHCFRVSDGNELWAFIPPSQLSKLNKIATNGDHEYYVDGNAIAKDIRVSTTYNDYRDWRTILVFSLGMGGKSYYALDITDPTAPAFLWETGDGYSGSHVDKTIVNVPTSGISDVLDRPIFGYTMGKPAIGVVPLASGPTAVVALSGGLDRNEVLGSADPEGKSIVILEAMSGAPVKIFAYSGSHAESASTWFDPQLSYSMPASPLLVDLNNDGKADRLYQGDIGGIMWRIDFDSSDPTNWEPIKIFDTNASISGGVSEQPIYIQPNGGYDENYNMWIFFGTGRRSSPNDQSSTGQFYAFRDDGLNYTPTNLQDITEYIEHNQDTVDTDGDGYPDTQETSQGTDPNDENDFPQTEDPWTDPLALDPGKQGVHFSFIKGTGEKLFEPTPIYIGGRVYFNTYLPPTIGGGSLDLCEPAGGMHLYQFRINYSSGTTFFGSVGVDESRILGSGVLSGGTFKIYVGGAGVGSTELESYINAEISGVFGPLFWIENKK